MTIPVTDQDDSIAESDGVIDFSWIDDRDLQKIQAENRKAIQIREILRDGLDWTRWSSSWTMILDLCNQLSSKRRV